MNVAFVCVWVGDRYGPGYVEILRDMLARNSTAMDHECAWFAITDRPDELPEGVYPVAANPDLPRWWAKLQLFDPASPWNVAGDRVVYFDLDVAITGRLEDLVERKGIIQDWHWPCLNSSVMTFDGGEHAEVWAACEADPDLINAPAGPDLAPLLPKGEINGGDQELLTRIGGWDTFPSDWFVSYRDAHAWPPGGCKAVIFHGNPKPHEITTGWVPNVWAIGGFTSFPELKGVNTTEDERLANVAINSARDLPWFTGFGDEGKACVIVCGAPSMRDHIADIRAHKRMGRRIVTVNNAWRTLAEHGIASDVHVMLDARQANVEFIKNAPKTMRFLLASQCHPDVFDALAEHEVVVWHSGHDNNERVMDILAPWWEPGPNQRPIILVPGGSTVGLRSLWLATFSGFRTVHLYGIDSSYASDGSHHAYAQALNDHEDTLEVVMGEKRYVCARWMIRQSAELQQTWADLRDYTDPDGKPAPVTIHVHGKGLIPDIAKALRAEERAAA